MATSKTKIFNMALNDLGVAAPILNADSKDDTRAAIMRNFYETSRDEVLKAYDWNFAENYTALEASETLSLDPKYQFIFDYPEDCICARDVFMQGGNGDRLKFKPSSCPNGKKIILANVPQIVLRYTRRVEDEKKFDSEYTATLALYLAAQTGQAITGSQQKADDSLKRYWDKLRLSKIVNASESLEVDEDNSTYLDAR